MSTISAAAFRCVNRNTVRAFLEASTRNDTPDRNREMVVGVIGLARPPGDQRRRNPDNGNTVYFALAASTIGFPIALALRTNSFRSSGSIFDSVRMVSLVPLISTVTGTLVAFVHDINNRYEVLGVEFDVWRPPTNRRQNFG
jgi:hypothetical protein